MIYFFRFSLVKPGETKLLLPEYPRRRLKAMHVKKEKKIKIKVSYRTGENKMYIRTIKLNKHGHWPLSCLGVAKILKVSLKG